MFSLPGPLDQGMSQGLARGRHVTQPLCLLALTDVAHDVVVVSPTPALVDDSIVIQVQSQGRGQHQTQRPRPALLPQGHSTQRGQHRQGRQQGQTLAFGHVGDHQHRQLQQQCAVQHTIATPVTTL